MDLTSPKTIRELLLKYQTKPNKTLGQNFLVHAPTLAKIIEAADIQPTDTILEIGPGIGTLTQELAKKAKRVVAVEKDRAMMEILKDTLRDCKNVEIIQGDVLEILENIELSSLRGAEKGVGEIGYFPVKENSAMSGANGHVRNRGFLRSEERATTGQSKSTNENTWSKTPLNDELVLPTDYKVVANIPYYLTSPLIRKFLESNNPPEIMVLMIQKEVAERICAKPPRMSILAVSVQIYADAKIISKVSKECFWPAPKIDSAIIKIIPRDSASISAPFRDTFFKVVKAGFSHPRKQLGNNFRTAFKKPETEINAWLKKNNITPSQRAQTLTIQDWVNLANQ